MSRKFDNESVAVTLTYADWTLVLACIGRERERVYGKAGRRENVGDFQQADALRERGRRLVGIKEAISAEFYNLRQSRRADVSGVSR